MKRAPGLVSLALVLAACGDDGEAPRVVRYPAVLSAPRDVVVARDGAIYVSEFSAGRISRVDETGATPVFTGLTTPIGLRELAPGVLLVAEEAPQSVARLDLATGVRTPLVDGLGNVTYLALGPDGAAYVSVFFDLDTPGRGLVYRVDPSTGATAVHASGLFVPEGLYLDGDALTVADWGTSTVVRFPPGGGDAGALVADGFDRVYGVADDGAGGCFVADHAGQVVHVAAGGARAIVLDDIGRPGGLARLPDGDLLVVEFVDFGAAGGLLRVTP